MEWNVIIALSTNGNEFSDEVNYCQLVKETQFYMLKYSWMFMKWVCTIRLQDMTVLFYHLLGFIEQGTSVIALTFVKC